MAHDHTAEQGDCLSKIAFEGGFFWQTLWDHPNNAGLKGKRTSPFVLLPGDTVHVPDPRKKTVSLATGKSHQFKRRGVPARLSVNVRSGGEPVANQPFEIDIDGQVTTGETDDDGLVSVYLAPNAQNCTLTVGEDPNKRTYKFKLRQLDPETETSGIQARLRNLGYFSGEIDGKLDDATEAAIRAFQDDQGLEVNGKNDSALQHKLIEVHGS